MYIFPGAHLNEKNEIGRAAWNHVTTTQLIQFELEALNAVHKLNYIIKLHIHERMKDICSNNGFPAIIFGS